MKIALIVSIALVAPFVLLIYFFHEALRSDSANALRKNARRRSEALRGAKLASAQAPAASAVEGEALVRLLADRTHVKEYRKRAGDAKPYLTTYDYFGPDGVHISSDTHSKRTDGYEDRGRWEVAGDLLCITTTRFGEKTSCYRIKLSEGGTIQYWNHQPGEETDGLLASIVSIVRPGLQAPEYTSDPAAFR